jgi:four helix bundle protein
MVSFFKIIVMAPPNVILDKSYNFSLVILQSCWKIQKDKKEYDLTRQLIRSATSIGANAEEAVGGISKKDFRAKMAISYKEARESKYWLRLMNDTHLMESKEAEKLINDCEEILKILYKIINTSRV